MPDTRTLKKPIRYSVHGLCGFDTFSFYSWPSFFDEAIAIASRSIENEDFVKMTESIGTITNVYKSSYRVIMRDGGFDDRKYEIGLYYKYKSGANNVVKFYDGLRKCLPHFKAKFQYEPNGPYTEELEFED